MSDVSVASRRSLATTRTAAAVITVGIGIASFVLSFTALADLAVRAGISDRLAWLWPLIVDGTILQATMAVVALAGVEDQQRNRRYFWIVLAVSAAVSVVGNGWHAVLPGSAPLSPWLAAAIAVVAPVSLLAATHGLSLLIRVAVPRAPLPQVPAVRAEVSPVAEIVDDPPTLVDEAHQPWVDVADVVVTRVGPADVDTVAAALHLSFERNLSPKSIGHQLGVEQDLILDIITVGDELISSGDMRVERVGV